MDVELWISALAFKRMNMRQVYEHMQWHSIALGDVIRVRCVCMVPTTSTWFCHPQIVCIYIECIYAIVRTLYGAVELVLFVMFIFKMCTLSPPVFSLCHANTNLVHLFPFRCMGNRCMRIELWQSAVNFLALYPQMRKLIFKTENLWLK